MNYKNNRIAGVVFGIFMYWRDYKNKKFITIPTNWRNFEEKPVE